MAPRNGGESPAAYGCIITCDAPTGTTALAPVEIGEIYKLSTAASYKLVAAVAADKLGGIANAPLVRTEERADIVKPIAVRVISRGFQRISALKYSGAAPTLGASVEADGAKAVRNVAYDGNSFNCYVDTTNLIVEVLH